jgi:murein DD-endopeptidase MepM/ murein hydrolase activator NlpD
MKRIIGYLMIFLIIFGISFRVEAKTLRDLKNELAAYEKEMSQAKSKKQMTQNEINNVNSRVRKIRETIEKDQENIKKTEDEIVELQAKALAKEDQIKDIISFLQITNSENAYMEYVFGAKSMEDLILRSAVSEQMVAYNDDLITDYNNTIVAYKAKNEDLKKQITNLNNEQDNLKTELVSLGDSLDAAQEEVASAKSLIDAQKKLINYYQNKLGCKDDQDITKCGTIPYSGKMIRPLTAFSITSEYGYRIHPISKKYKFHSGMDLAGGSGEAGTAVYGVAPGTVAGISWKNSCGGTMLFIHHNINGTYYTVTYMHLYKVNVKVGDYIDQNTKVAVTGGYKTLTPWDTCSTGRHLHFSITRGLYLKDYTSWSTWTSKLINPRTLVNFPKAGSGTWVSNRTKKY